MRQGFFLNVALALIVLLGLLILTYFNFMRGQSRLTQGMVAGEVAHHLAQAGIAAGVAYFTNTRQPCRLHKKVSTEGPDQINGQIEPLPIRDNPVVARLLSEYNDEASLSVDLELANFKPFYSKIESESGIVYGTVEKFGSLKVTSTGAYHGVKRRVIAFKDVKVIDLVPYVVSKFTLFLQEKPPGCDPNLVVVKKTDIRNGEPDRANHHGPIFFRHGPARNLEENGWVFLGGGDYRLNLTWGESGWGEQFLLLKKGWVITSDPEAALPLPPNYVTAMLQRGFFDQIKADNDLLDHFDFDGGPDPVTQRATVLHLFGAPAESGVDSELDVSPTYVLGQVRRRFLDLRYIRRVSDGKKSFLPCSTLTQWQRPAPAPWPSTPEFGVKTEVFGGDFERYVPYMSNVPQIQTRKLSYNRSVDYMVEPQELDPPYRLMDTVRVTHRMPQNRDFLYEPSLNTGDVVLRTQSGKKLFDGNLSRILMDDLYLKRRAIYTMPAVSFARFLAKNKRVPGIVLLTGGDVTIGKDVEFESGGIIAASGSITIRANVRVKPYGRPLVLASLSGNVNLKGARRVQASLVALNGTINREPGSPLDVCGNLVARSVDLDKFTGGSDVGKVVYDSRLDPTSGTGANYAVYLSPSRDYYLVPNP
jgi:hypothetical protein